jgi:hypothetical protein
MKKFYIKSLSFLFMTFSIFNANSQSDKLLGTAPLSSAEKKAKLENVQNRDDVQKSQAGCNDTLVTTLAAGNNYHGNMFDIVPNANITIETFHVTVDGTENIAIFYRTGTFVGHETSSAGWIFLDSAIVTGAGAGVPVQVPVSLGLNLNSGSTYGFYVTATSSGAIFHYTNGTAVGNVLSSNADLSVLEGNGGSYPFSVTFSPRNFNGRVQYCLTTTNIDEYSATQGLDVYPNPSNGLFNIDLSSFNSEDVTLKVYNIVGKEIINKKVTNASNNYNIDLTNQPEGMYIIKVLTENKKYISKVVIE